jgi:hypothetical protein
MIQRGGAVVIRMLANVQQATIRPLIPRFITPGTRVHTDAYVIYNRLPADWNPH